MDLNVLQRFFKTVFVVKGLSKRRRAHVALRPIMSDLLSYTISRSLLFLLSIVFSAFQPFQNVSFSDPFEKSDLGTSLAKYYGNACSAFLSYVHC